MFQMSSGGSEESAQVGISSSRSRSAVLEVAVLDERCPATSDDGPHQLFLIVVTMPGGDDLDMIYMAVVHGRFAESRRSRHCLLATLCGLEHG
mmetsp:Transcript_15983/g.34576  ORF Transcript_15983/g.34576 Transcript_15983/m.34576 type:complete len:93 (+) Transcript_15983:284-562(+)